MFLGEDLQQPLRDWDIPDPGVCFRYIPKLFDSAIQHDGVADVKNRIHKVDILP